MEGIRLGIRFKSFQFSIICPNVDSRFDFFKLLLEPNCLIQCKSID